MPDGIPPWYYFDTILPLLEADGTAGACVALTKSCQMAITVTAGGESTLQVDPPTPPARNVILLMQSHLLLHHYFPTLLGTQPPIHDFQPLVAHLTAYQNEQTVHQDQAWQEKIEKERTTVAVWLGPENFSCLLCYSQVASEDHLSLLWKALAGASARDRLMILQTKVRGKLLSMDAVFLAEEFTVDLDLLIHLTSLQWAMITPESLETGCLGNAFLFTDSDVKERQRINKQLQLIQSGGTTPSLLDAQSILKMMVNLSGADDSVRCILHIQAFFFAVLPIGHPITSFLAEHYRVMKAFDPGWAHHETSNPLLSPLKGVYHLQWLSLHLTQYFKSLDCTEGHILCPNPLDIVNKIQIQEKWEPNLSATFWDRYGLRSFVCFHSVSLKDNGTVATDMLSISGGSSLGTGTRGGPPTGGLDETKATNTQLDNTHFNSSLFGTYKSTSVKSAALCKNIADGTIDPLPMSKVDSTMPMCLA